MKDQAEEEEPTDSYDSNNPVSSSPPSASFNQAGHGGDGGEQGLDQVTYKCVDAV